MSATPPRYVASIAIGAMLLFLVQPLMGRYVVPWFGGAAAAWAACLVFFQVCLLAGYGYAHGLGRLRPRTQAIVHIALLALSLATLPITPAERWRPGPDGQPVPGILGLLTASIGLPFLLLASTGPLLQSWLTRERPGYLPWRLYALSNAAALVGLVLYPFVVEPNLGRSAQSSLFGWLYAAFAAATAWCALKFTRAEPPTPLPPLTPATPTSQLTLRLLWLALPAAASALLIAITNQLTTEVAPVPLLWVLPLALYLLSFTIAFDHPRWYDRRLWGPLLVATTIAAIVFVLDPTRGTLAPKLVAGNALLFVCALCCHGELARLTPPPEKLTLFYLFVAAGGALGGSAVALGAPLLFKELWEFPLSLAACCLMLLVAGLRGRDDADDWLRIAGIGVLFVVGIMLLARSRGDRSVTLLQSRNFYGALRVTRRVQPNVGWYLALTHGRTLHGTEIQKEGFRSTPTTYYGNESGIGLALRLHPHRLAVDSPAVPLRIGVIGLGTGTLAAYGLRGDTVRFYEINPNVVRIARDMFTYVRDSRAVIELAVGDARIALENELAAGRPQRFDVLAVDAFSSDAIPMHLLTTEALALYRRHMAPGGLIALHISNRFLDLGPVTRGLAEALGLRAFYIVTRQDATRGLNGAAWVVLGDSANPWFGLPAVDSVETQWRAGSHAPITWTDDVSSLWPILNLR